MKRPLFLLMLVFFASPLAAADPKFNADAAMKKLAPFIDDETFLVQRLDLRRLDLAAAVSLAEPILPTASIVKETVRSMQSTLNKNGAREIYIVYDATDFSNSPCVLVPLGEWPVERKGLYETLRQFYQGEETAWENINGFWCIGVKAGLTRLKSRKPSERPDIAEALASTGDSPLQAVFAPTAAMRKVFEDIAPKLPDEIGGGSIQTFTKGLKWVSLAVGPAPNIEARIIFKETFLDISTSCKNS